MTRATKSSATMNGATKSSAAMSRARLTAVVLAGLLLVAAPLPGCWMVAAGAGAAAGVVYTAGALEAHLDGTSEEVVAAAEQSLRDLGLTIESAAASTFDGKVVARTADDSRVTVTVEANSAAQCALSKVTIRYGILGDESKSRVILSGIRTHL